ncbi:MAG: hypothetical protein ACRDNS_10090 [Trebonia sp.]
MSGPASGQDAFPRSRMLRAELVRHGHRYGATLELPDGSREDLAAGSETDVRAEVLAAARRFLHQEGQPFGRLTVADPDRMWELALPVDAAQEPVVLREAVRTGAGPASEFPAQATLAATVARTRGGQYGATLTLPDGQQRVFAGAELDSVRARVLEDARRYLATEVGRPGRLEVTDPDGSWVLGIPHDGGELLAIASAASGTSARTVLLPSRSTIPTRCRPRWRGRSHGHWSLSDRRFAALALLATVILVVVLVEALGHNGPASTTAKHTRTANQNSAARSSRQLATASKPKPKPVPKTRPARHEPTTQTVVHHHKTAAPKTHGAAKGTSHHRAGAAHHPTASIGTPAVTPPASTPVVTATPPVQTPTSPAPTHTTRTAPLPTPSGPPPL